LFPWNTELGAVFGWRMCIYCGQASYERAVNVWHREPIFSSKGWHILHVGTTKSFISKVNGDTLAARDSSFTSATLRCLIQLPHILHRPNIPLPPPNSKVSRTRYHHSRKDNNGPVHSRHRQQRSRHRREESNHKDQTQPPQRNQIHTKAEDTAHRKSRWQERLSGEFAPDDARDAYDVGGCEGTGAERSDDVESSGAADVDERYDDC
jgi:hypothetical protein